MTERLKNRIDALRTDIEAASEPDRTALTEKLAQAVQLLEDRGGRAPRWAEARISAAREAELEDMFDNLPV